MICGDKADIKDVSTVDYDLFCNIPKRELVPAECISLLELQELIKQSPDSFALVDTRDKIKFEEVKEKAIHVPLFELINSLDVIKSLAGKRISILLFNRS